MNSNLPAGCTNADIERHFGSSAHEELDYIRDELSDVVQKWDGIDLIDLFCAIATQRGANWRKLSKQFSERVSK